MPQDLALLELSQALCEHVRAHVGEAGPQVGEALGAQQELAHDHQGPALAHQVEGAGDSAGIAVGALCGHGGKF